MGHLTSATPTPRLEQLLLRRAERSMQAEAKARADADAIRRANAAEDDEARAAFMTATAEAHRRWGRSEP